MDNNNKTPMITKLNANNFITWKSDIMSILGYHELTHYLKRDPPKLPEVVTNNEDGTVTRTPTTDPVAMEKYFDEVEKFEIKSFKALSILRLYMEQAEKHEIIDATTVKEAWTKLLSRHEQQTVARTLMLRRKLYFQTKVGKGGIAAHFNRIEILVEELRGTMAPVKSYEQMMIMLMTLPEEYDAVTTVLMMKNEKELTVEVIKNALLEQEAKQKANSSIRKDEKDAQERALKAAEDSKGKLKCTNCKKKGHTVDRCWAKGGGAEGQGP